jgi:nucleoside-diphosphate-sugar epimerase
VSAALSVLLIGGTGVISSAVADLAVRSGHRVTVLNRGRSTLRPAPDGAEVLVADAGDPVAVARALGSRSFDAVVNFIAFTPADVEPHLALFRERTGQYMFISSASAYQKPPGRLPIRESTPLRNPYWQYARDKIACEDVLVAAYRNSGFPATIVRPSHTYDRTKIALSGGWGDIVRMRAGLPVVVHGDGTSLWTVTHSTDLAKGLVGLLGLPQAVGESFTITSEEALPWDAIYRIYAKAAGVPDPDFVHVASDTIARLAPERGPALLGDKAHSVVFDNAKIRAFVPGFACTTPFARGAREVLEWFDADPARQRVEPGYDALTERIIAAVR